MRTYSNENLLGICFVVIWQALERARKNEMDQKIPKERKKTFERAATAKVNANCPFNVKQNK